MHIYLKLPQTAPARQAIKLQLIVIRSNLYYFNEYLLGKNQMLNIYNRYFTTTRLTSYNRTISTVTFHLRNMSPQFICSFIFSVLMLVSFAHSQCSNSNRSKICDVDYCDTVRCACPLVECNKNTVPVTVPQLCQCCPRCYQPVGRYIHLQKKNSLI